MNQDAPITRSVIKGIEATRVAGIEAFIEALEEGGNMRLPGNKRKRYLQNDPEAVIAASNAMLGEGDVAPNLGAWTFPCLIFVGAGDADFYDQARRAADEIPNAELLALEGAGHLAAHLQHETVIPAMLRTLRSAA